MLPRLYAIVDAGPVAREPDPTAALLTFTRELLAGGATLIQYRNKQGSARQMLAEARELRRIVCAAGPRPEETSGPAHARAPQRPPGRATRDERSAVFLIMNDRVDLAIAAGFDGVHLGQDDLSPEAARRILAAAQGQQTAQSPDSATLQKPLWMGVSTHSAEQVAAADQTSADYIAVGPVFATASKASADAVIGLAGVRAARRATAKPLVAIGGITRANFRSVLDAGADSVAVISDLLLEPRAAAQEFQS